MLLGVWELRVLTHYCLYVLFNRIEWQELPILQHVDQTKVRFGEGDPTLHFLSVILSYPIQPR